MKSTPPARRARYAARLSLAVSAFSPPQYPVRSPHARACQILLATSYDANLQLYKTRVQDAWMTMTSRARSALTVPHAHAPTPVALTLSSEVPSVTRSVAVAEVTGEVIKARTVVPERWRVERAGRVGRRRRLTPDGDVRGAV